MGGHFSRDYFIAVQEIQWNAYHTLQAGGRVWLSAENPNTIMLDTDMALLMDPDSCNAFDSFKGDFANVTSYKVGDNCKTNDAIAAIVKEYALDFDGTKFFPEFSTAFQKLLSLGAQTLQPELQVLGVRMTSHTLKDCTAADACTRNTDCPNQFFPNCDITSSPSKCVSLTCANNDDCPHARAARCDFVIFKNRCRPCDSDDQCEGSRCDFGECVSHGPKDISEAAITSGSMDAPAPAAPTAAPATLLADSPVSGSGMLSYDLFPEATHGAQCFHESFDDAAPPGPGVSELCKPTAGIARATT